MKQNGLWLAVTFFALFFLFACALKHDPDAPRYSNDGQVFVYLSCCMQPCLDISFTLSEIGFMDGQGKWYDVALGARTINAAELSRGAIRLKEFYLPEGRYRKLRWIISEATYRRQNKEFRLALPDAFHNETVNGRVVTETDFQVLRDESLCLFAKWDADRSIADKYLFEPGFTTKPQGLEIENILAYVSNEASNCVTVIDREEDEVVGTIAVGKAPRGITVSSNGARVYVANSGSNDISVIDTSANRVINTIGNLGNAPEEFAWSWDNNLLYVTNPYSNNVSVIDVHSAMVSCRINVGTRPTGIVADNDRRKIYVANTDSLTVSVIDMYNQTLRNTFRVSSSPRNMAVCDDRLYVGNETMDDNIYLVELPGYSVRALSIGSRPGHLVCGLANRVYTANPAANEVSFLHIGSEMITRTIPVGSFPAGMALDHVRRKLYVVNSGSADLSVIDVRAEKVKKTIQTGNKPYGIAFVDE